MTSVFLLAHFGRSYCRLTYIGMSSLSLSRACIMSPDIDEAPIPLMMM